MSRTDASLALERLRILDLTRVRAGPTCVKHFADFGADVIKVESVESEQLGEVRESPDFQNLHRNKRSLAIDLKSPEGRALFARLARTADVVVENYRPGVKLRLGLDYESLRALNPRIVLASISGFGQEGPYRDRPGYDQIAQGMSGLMSVTGRPGEGPMRAGAAVCDVSAGLLAALGILTALFEREVSGEGQWVQSNLLQAGIALLDFQAARYTVAGEVPRQVGNDHPTSMPTSTYRTADGHVNVAASGDAMWRRLCDTLERADLIEHPDFGDETSRSRNRRALNAELEQALAVGTTAEWVERLNAVGVPCGPIYRMDEVFADPQVRHLEASAEVAHPSLGTIALVNQPVKLSRTPGRLAAPAPERGEHTDEVLRELGCGEAEIARLRAERVVA